MSTAGPEQGAPFRPRYAEGYIFALLSATGYGLSPIFIRLGLENHGLAASIAGGLISYVAATAVMAVVLIWPGQLRHALAVKPKSAKWFTLSGVMVCVSQMFIYMALSIAPVTVVSPINRLTIVFRLYFSRLLNPQHEVFGGKVIAGTLVSLAGAVLLSLSTELVAVAAAAARGGRFGAEMAMAVVIAPGTGIATQLASNTTAIPKCST